MAQTHIVLLQNMRLQLWDAIVRLLRHPHMWVETAASRLLGLAFARCAPPVLIHMRVY